jgi:probable rRNA maturation factor
MQRRIAGLDEAALERFVARAKRAAGLKATVNVLVSSSVELRTLNRRFRGKNKTTDVLSFPFPLPTLAGRGISPGRGGDIAISADIAARNAIQLGHSPAQEVKVLALHGILHLAGFDHERDNGEMARKELKLRRLLKLPLGLTERAHPVARPSMRRRK